MAAGYYTGEVKRTQEGGDQGPFIPIVIKERLAVSGHSRSILAVSGHSRSIDTFPRVWLVTSDAQLLWLGSQANLDVIPAFLLNQPLV